MKLRSFLPLIASGFLAACSTVGPVGNTSVPQPAKTVQLDRYLGNWFELARYENSFETDCEGVTAQYSLRDDGMIKVINTCRKDSPDGTKKGCRRPCQDRPQQRQRQTESPFLRSFLW